MHERKDGQNEEEKGDMQKFSMHSIEENPLSAHGKLCPALARG
jgi:hypothetical protein